MNLLVRDAQLLILDINMLFLNTLVAYVIPWIPRALIQKIAKRYIAGDDLSQAVIRIRQLNAQGFSVTVDVLGESVSNSLLADETAHEYLQVLQAIQMNNLLATVSIKPSAMGLVDSTIDCEQRLERIIKSALDQSTSVCLDMEDITCTQLEIDLFTNLQLRYKNVSLALQAYLTRTYDDINMLLRKQSSLRICKGIYLEDPSHLVPDAWLDRSAINEHFLAHIESCFLAGTFVSIATHDAKLIKDVISIVKRHNISRSLFEFQMLLGVCEPIRDKLLKMGFSIRIYVPYGKDWYGYSIRRLKENPYIAGQILRSIIGI